jgi:hypothetical protein
MKVVAFIRDPVVVHKILDHLNMLCSSGNDPPRGPQTLSVTMNPSMTIYPRAMSVFLTADLFT